MYKYKIKEISKGRFLLTPMRIIIYLFFFLGWEITYLKWVCASLLVFSDVGQYLADYRLDAK